MYTASYFDKTIPSSLAKVGISQGVPRWLGGSTPVYKKLAPSWALVKMAKAGRKEEYFDHFVKQLQALDANQVVDEIMEITEGVEPVLLCWEKAPLTCENWCHRTMVAKWLTYEAGIEVKEWSGLHDLHTP